MSILYGVNATKRQNQTIAQLEEQGQSKGHVLSAYDTYELLADVVGGTDTLRMSKLPAGARVIDVRLFFDDLDAAGGTLDIGWEAGADAVEAADADGFLANVDVTSQGTVSMFEDQPSVAGFQKVFSEEVQVTVTFDADTDATSGTISLDILYVID